MTLETSVIPKLLPYQVQDVLMNYLCLKLGNKCVPCPYWQQIVNKDLLSKFKRFLFPYAFDGKGTPSEIETVTISESRRLHLNLDSATTQEIQKFMRRKGIGVDCSGLAFQLLDAFNKSKGHSGIATKLKRTPSSNLFSFFKQTRYQVSADYLTTYPNSIEIKKLTKIKSGDMIRLNRGKHVIIILEVTNKEIIYAHSSQKLTQQKGVQIGKIFLKNSNIDLKLHEWQQLTPLGKTLGEEYFDKKNGDGVFRLKIWG